MRIIAGSKKGMKLFSPKTFVSRPITDKVKESVFDVLENHNPPAEKRAADLFCGVGSLGLEALSRGAGFVTFVEKDGGVLKMLRRNIAKCSFSERCKVYKRDAFKTGACLVQNERYDLVFVDPPYAATKETSESSALGALLLLLNEQVSPGGWVVVRTRKGIQLQEKYGSLEVIDVREWGTMMVSLLRSGEK